MNFGQHTGVPTGAGAADAMGGALMQPMYAHLAMPGQAGKPHQLLQQPQQLLQQPQHPPAQPQPAPQQLMYVQQPAPQPSLSPVINGGSPLNVPQAAVIAGALLWLPRQPLAAARMDYRGGAVLTVALVLVSDRSLGVVREGEHLLLVVLPVLLPISSSMTEALTCSLTMTKTPVLRMSTSDPVVHRL